MQPTDTLDGMLAFNANWTGRDRETLSRVATAASITDWRYFKNGNRPGYWGSNAAGERLVWVMAGRVRVHADHASTTVPLLAESGLDPQPTATEPWASHEVLLSNAGGTGRARGATTSNADAAIAAVPVLRAAALANQTLTYAEFAEAVGTVPRNAGAVLKIFMISGEDARRAAFVVDPATGEPSHGHTGTAPAEARAAAHRLARLLHGDD
jgi:hypothetical protein